MECPFCGKEVEGNFCNYCGASLAKQKIESDNINETPLPQTNKQEKPFYETGWFYAVIILLFMLTKTSYGKNLLYGVFHQNISKPVQQVVQVPNVKQPQVQLEKSSKPQNPDITNKSSEFPIQIIDHTLEGRYLDANIKNISNETIDEVYININFYDIKGVHVDDQIGFVSNIEGNGLAHFRVIVNPSVDFPYSYKFVKITTISSSRRQINNNPVTVQKK